MHKLGRISLVAGMAVLASWACWGEEAKWVAAMRQTHAGFQGTAGHVAQLGDSITYSMAFWKPFSWSDPDAFLPDDALPKKPAEQRWRDTIKGAGNEGKGGEAGNYSGWTAAQLLQAVPGVISRNKPEAAIIMIGTNDARGNKLRPTYAEELGKIVQLCLDAHCVPILSTIPPMRGCADSVAEANRIVKDLAAKQNVPLVDYHAAILERAPDGKWDGTLISGDGVHPSGGETHVFSKENLAKSGYALRNYVTFLGYREVYFKVLHPAGQSSTLP
jgi:lysophospholipase L1-like esterase